MDPEFWLERWQKNEIGFHAADVQPALVKHWPALALDKGARVLVPLCGKSLDMVWLAGQGHEVVGAELSDVALKDFIAEQYLTYVTTEEADGFTIHSSGPFELWCGDYFALKKDEVAADRRLRPRGAGRHAARDAAPLRRQACRADAGGRSRASDRPRLRHEAKCRARRSRFRRRACTALFEKDFDVTLLEARDGLTKAEHLKKRGVTRLEEAAYLLQAARMTSSPP